MVLSDLTEVRKTLDKGGDIEPLFKEEFEAVLIEYNLTTPDE